jgi:hypothetical protein
MDADEQDLVDEILARLPALHSGEALERVERALRNRFYAVDLEESAEAPDAGEDKQTTEVQTGEQSEEEERGGGERNLVVASIYDDGDASNKNGEEEEEEEEEEEVEEGEEVVMAQDNARGSGTGENNFLATEIAAFKAKFWEKRRVLMSPARFQHSTKVSRPLEAQRHGSTPWHHFDSTAQAAEFIHTDSPSISKATNLGCRINGWIFRMHAKVASGEVQPQKQKAKGAEAEKNASCVFVSRACPIAVALKAGNIVWCRWIDVWWPARVERLSGKEASVFFLRSRSSHGSSRDGGSGKEATVDSSALRPFLSHFFFWAQSCPEYNRESLRRSVVAAAKETFEANIFEGAISARLYQQRMQKLASVLPPLLSCSACADIATSSDSEISGSSCGDGSRSSSSTGGSANNAATAKKGVKRSRTQAFERKNEVLTSLKLLHRDASTRTFPSVTDAIPLFNLMNVEMKTIKNTSHEAHEVGRLLIACTFVPCGLIACTFVPCGLIACTFVP